MSSKERKDQIAASLRSLVTAHSKTLAHLEDALAVLCKELDLGKIEMFDKRPLTHRDLAHDPEDAIRPTADQHILSVRWHGKSCFLGNTLSMST